MKKLLCLPAAVILAVLFLCSCGDVSHATVDIGTSKLYSEADRNELAGKIKQDFLCNYDACTLHSIEYAGDKRSQSDLELAREEWEEDFTDCAVFIVSFRSPADADKAEALNPDFEYEYSWTFVKRSGGSWEKLTAGQG